jgi:hypothetical protein
MAYLPRSKQTPTQHHLENPAAVPTPFEWPLPFSLSDAMRWKNENCNNNRLVCKKGYGGKVRAWGKGTKGTDYWTLDDGTLDVFRKVV